MSNRRLVAFARTFDKVGVGYYPNSVFVHVDTRDKRAFWIDYSKPGEKAIYGRAGMKKSEIEAIRAKRRGKKAKQVLNEVKTNIDELVASIKPEIET